MYMTRHQRLSRRVVPAMLAAIALPLAACSGSGSAADADSAAPADVNAAKEQAKQFRTAGMPDDWINFGEFYQSVCDSYDLGCNGFAAQGVNRTDTDMSSAEEIAAFKNETTNAPMCSDIGIAFGQVAESEGVLLGYTPEAAAALPAQYKAADGGWVASAVGVISIMTNTDVIPNPPITIGISEWANSPGSSRRRCASTPPVHRAAAQNVPATTHANSASPAVRTAVAAIPESVRSSTNPRNCGVAEKLSNAVDPSNTDSTATIPGRTGSDGRWSNGLPNAMRPSVFRRKGDTRDATTL